MQRVWLQLAIVAILSAVFLGYGIQRSSVGTPYSDPYTKIRAQDESSYANSALGFVDHGGWLTPKILGRFQMNKPPLLVWLAGFSLKVFGMSLWAFRVPAWIAAILGTMIVFWWAQRAAGIYAAAIAALLLLSNPLWNIFSRLCYTDMLVAASITGALAILYADPTLARSRSLWGFAACVAACVMAKSVAGLLPIFVLGVYCLLVPRDMRPTWTRAALATLASIVLFAPWHIYELIVHRKWFWADYVQLQLLGWGTQPPGQNAPEGPLEFYFKRLALTDPLLAVLFVIAVPFLIAALRRRDRMLPALLASWFAVVTAALLANRFLNLPYALSLIVPAALIIAIYNPLFSGSRAKWGALALCGILAFKCAEPAKLWGLNFGAAPPLDAVASLRTYYAMDRSNELILANSDDFFYATTLPLPRVRYYFRVPDDVLRNFIPHYVYLGIMLTEEEFERIDQLTPAYAARLRDWGIDSTEPIGTAILSKSDDALPRLIAARPDSDFYVTAADLPRLDRSAILESHSITSLPDGNAFLLARRSNIRRAAPLPAHW